MTFAIIRLTTKEVMQLNVVQELAARTLLVILAAAVVQDFMYMKISNRLILMGILFSLAFGLTTGGPKQVIYVLANLSFSGYRVISVISPGSTWGGRHQTIFHYRRIYKFQIVDKLYVLFFCSGSCYCGMQNVI